MGCDAQCLIYSDYFNNSRTRQTCAILIIRIRKLDRIGQSDRKMDESTSRPVRNMSKNRGGVKPVIPIQNRKNRKNQSIPTVGRFFHFVPKSNRKNSQQ